MEIHPGIEIHGLSLYIQKNKALVIGDLHLGYEDELREHGYMVPRLQYKQTTAHIDEISSKVDVKSIIINGDLKHEFGRISQQEWQEVSGFLDYLAKKTEEITLVKGNHDTILGPIASRKDVTVVPGFFFKETHIYVTHGHIIPNDPLLDKAKVVIIAHDHPAITLSEGVRSEKVKCFLKGYWKRKVLIQMPSLSYVTEGTDVTKENPLSPFMNQQLNDFEVYGVEGLEVLYFGKLKNLYRLL